MDLRRSINTKIWDDVWFESLTSEEKLVWLYLLTNKNTNMLGVYELSEKKIAFEIGLPLENIRKAFKSFESQKRGKYINGYVVLFNWIKNQSYNTNMKKSALSDYHKLPTSLKISIKTVIEFNLIESFGSLSKDYLMLPKNEKESEGEEEKESDIHDQVIDSLLVSEKWIELTAKNSKREISDIKTLLNEFRIDCVVRNNLKENESDAKNHFSNWILKKTQIEKSDESKPKYALSSFQNNDF